MKSHMPFSDIQEENDDSPISASERSAQRLHDLMDRVVDEDQAAESRKTVEETPGVKSMHDIRPRKLGDMIVADAHIEVDATLTVEAGHDIAVEARRRVMQRHRVLNLMTHVDPWKRPDDDHGPVAQAPRI